MNTRRITSFILLAVLSSCSTRNGDGNVFPLDQLVGRWEIMTAESQQIEEWSKQEDGSMVGQGYVLLNNDTTFIEFLSIEMVRDTPVYKARISELEGAETVAFKAMRNNARSIEFVNEANDFPKRIGYILQDENHIHVYLEGPNKGKTVRHTLDFIRSDSR